MVFAVVVLGIIILLAMGGAIFRKRPVFTYELVIVPMLVRILPFTDDSKGSLLRGIRRHDAPGYPWPIRPNFRAP